MHKRELRKIIKKGENKTIEFKSQVSEGIGKSICSFANTNDGIILVGISDKGSIEGINKKHEKEIANIAHSCKPSVYPDVISVEIKGKNVFVVKVKKSDSLHSFKNISYKRIASHDKPLSPEEVIEFAKDSGKIRWDEQVCEGARRANINQEAVSRFRELYENVNKTKIKGSDKELLSALNCIKEVNRDIKITNAGILLFGKNPKKFFAMDYVTVVRYPGKEKAQTYLDIKEFHGNLFDIVDHVEEYIKQHIQEVSKVVEGKLARKVIPQYPYFAIRELITNAIVHRDYSIFGSRIIIRMFKDRIEFNSPGRLPANIKPENIVNEQFSRNLIIADVFSQVHYIEKLGEGWDKIIESVKKHPFRPKLPEIKDTGNTLIVTLFSPKEELLESAPVNAPVNAPVKLSYLQLEIIEKIKANNQITYDKLANLFNKNRTTIMRNINQLKKLNKIKRVGSDKKGCWEVIGDSD